MRILELTPKNINYKDYVKRSAKEGDYSLLINEPTVGVLNGKVKFIYDIITDRDMSDIVHACKTIKYQESERSNGLVTRSRTFGYRPRITFRNDFCSISSLAGESAQAHTVIASYAKVVEEIYAKYNPETHTKHKQQVEETIKPQWKIEDSVFTSGIINKNNPLRYHFDAGNIPDVASCMLVFKQDIEGGYLAMPEYGVGVELVNNSILIFDGQSIMHGVTPIRQLSENAYRYSLVYYSLKSIWNCLPLDEEIARIRNKKTERERIRANMSEELKQEYIKKYSKKTEQ